jgi:PadR family transcriptional regulator, regulatory protein PadR
VNVDAGRGGAVGSRRRLPFHDLRELRRALSKLDERPRRILELRHGLAGERRHSLAEIGELLGLSRQRVRQIESSALQKLGLEGPGAVEPRGLPRNFMRPCILLSLRELPAHGYGLLERLRLLGLRDPDPGRVYKELRKLEAQGFVASRWERSKEGGGARRVYELTGIGTNELHEHVKRLIESRDALQAFLGRYEEFVSLKRKAPRSSSHPPPPGEVA